MTARKAKTKNVAAPKREPGRLEVGEVVTLKSGGFKMTVLGFACCNQVRVIWTSEGMDGKCIETDVFPENCFERDYSKTEVPF